MTRQDALRMLEETVGAEPNTLTGGEALRDILGWDSLSALAFITVVDKEVGLPLRGSQVARCQTVEGLLELLGVAPASRAA
jgi:acyl carrier protein